MPPCRFSYRYSKSHQLRKSRLSQVRGPDDLAADDLAKTENALPKPETYKSRFQKQLEIDYTQCQPAVASHHLDDVEGWLEATQKILRKSDERLAVLERAGDRFASKINAKHRKSILAVCIGGPPPQSFETSWKNYEDSIKSIKLAHQLETRHNNALRDSIAKWEVCSGQMCCFIDEFIEQQTAKREQCNQETQADE